MLGRFVEQHHHHFEQGEKHMSRASAKSRTNTADSTPLVDPHTYTDGVGFEPGNAAGSTKYRKLDGSIVDDLGGEQGFVVVQKGDRVTPEIARLLEEGGPDMTRNPNDVDDDDEVEADNGPLGEGQRPRQSPELVDAAADERGEV